MPLDIKVLRQLVDSDPSDTMLRYVLGQKLYEEDGTPAAMEEAAMHLAFVRRHDARNVAAWVVLARVQIDLGRLTEARQVLHDCQARIEEGAGIDGTDLLPQIEELLDEIG